MSKLRIADMPYVVGMELADETYIDTVGVDLTDEQAREAYNLAAVLHIRVEDVVVSMTLTGTNPDPVSSGFSVTVQGSGLSAAETFTLTDGASNVINEAKPFEQQDDSQIMVSLPGGLASGAGTIVVADLGGHVSNTLAITIA